MKQPFFPPKVRFILVRPRNPLNIGAAARAMSNFGFSDLAVVKPYAPVWRETVSAVGAERLVLQARAVHSLDEAVGDCQIVFGTTTTRRRRLERPLVRLPDLPAFLRKHGPKAGHVAILFGPEKTGLTNRYLERCHYILTVPTDSKCPSMNLGQSVATCCYELSRPNRRLGPRSAARESPPATVGQMRQLVRHAMQVFEAADYLSFLSPSEKTRKIRRTFLQWKVRRTDAALLHGVFRYLLKRLNKDGQKMPAESSRPWRAASPRSAAAGAAEKYSK